MSSRVMRFRSLVTRVHPYYQSILSALGKQDDGMNILSSSPA